MSSSSFNVCFNSQCKESRSDQWRKGWRLRTGDFAELCDRCFTAYEETTFCETFHSDSAGWRSCESCRKRVHCGCIVSVHTFVLLDAGGVECLACAGKSSVLVSNPQWPSSLFLPLFLPEKPNDLFAKNWNHINGLSSVPGQWLQAHNTCNTSSGQSESHPQIPYEVDRLSDLEKLIPGEQAFISAQRKKKIDDQPESITSCSRSIAAFDRPATGKAGSDTATALNIFRKEDTISLQDFSHLRRVNDPMVTIGSNIPVKDVSSNLPAGLPLSFSSLNMTDDSTAVSGIQSQRQMPPSSNPLAKQFFANLHNGIDSSWKLQTQTCNGKPQVEGQGQNQSHPQFCPRITDQEPQQLSGDSKSVLTPLFEKMLSASDASRIGRLVLPKKCAEQYFPTISQPEGLPLKFQDARGKDWVFQFRFWPNNKSRMYVLEGVTPCIHSMELQAGDIVTFSRIDPEGKLVMGYRKASSIPSGQDIETVKTGNVLSTCGEVNNKNSKSNEGVSALPLQHCKSNADIILYTSINQVEPGNAVSKFDTAGSISKGPGPKSALLPNRRKRKSCPLGPKSKRLRMKTENSTELKLTLEEAQVLLRSPPEDVPSIVVIEGLEFEEYEEAPVLGKPTILTSSHTGEESQWAQCEDCSKWRKLPINALLPPRWTCFDNFWDPERSSCSSAQELSTEQLNDLCISRSGVCAAPLKKPKEETNPIELSPDGHDKHADATIIEESWPHSSSTQSTSKHPRHRPGCSCIVCIQPPSGKGPKHPHDCTCTVCLTIQRRFHTQKLRREKRRMEQIQMSADPDTSNKSDDAIFKNEGSTKQKMVDDQGVDGGIDSRRLFPSFFKGGIDLNIQPEREEEPSIGQQDTHWLAPGGIPREEKINSGGPHNSSCVDADMDRPVALSMPILTSTSAKC